jgi:hypothetical protein
MPSIETLHVYVVETVVLSLYAFVEDISLKGWWVNN